MNQVVIPVGRKCATERFLGIVQLSVMPRSQHQLYQFFQALKGTDEMGQPHTVVKLCKFPREIKALLFFFMKVL